MKNADLIVLVVYVAGVVGLGCWFARGSATTKGFMAAGGKLPGWVVGLSIFGTFVSSISFLANPGKSFDADWNPFVFGLSLPVAPLTGWDVKAIIIATGILVTVYTLIGGIEAVIWTDVVQSVVLTVGILLSLGLIFSRMPEGPAQVFEIAAEQDKFLLGSFGASLSEPTFWVIFVFGLFINLQNFGIDQSYVQRYATAKSDQAASRSVWLGALLYVPISALLFLVGTGLHAFYTAQPELLPEGVESVAAAHGDKMFPHFIATQMPAGVTGLLIAAVLAAAMSSVDSSLNGSATLTWCDLIKRFRRKQDPVVDEVVGMRVLRGATVGFGVLGTGAALAMLRVKSALDAWWMISSVFSGGILGLFLLGLIVRRAGNVAAAIGVVLGVLVISWLTLSRLGLPESVKPALHGNLTIVVGTLTIFLVGLGISRLNPKPSSSDV